MSSLQSAREMFSAELPLAAERDRMRSGRATRKIGGNSAFFRRGAQPVAGCPSHERYGVFDVLFFFFFLPCSQPERKVGGNGTPVVGTWTVKSGLAQMLKGGVIMDVTNAEQARIAEEVTACNH
jgi:hypothetical protein